MKKHLCVLLITLLVVPEIASQPKRDASIFGKIKFISENISFATVSIRGTTHGINTDENGNYILAGLPAGKHMVKAQSVGYKPVEREVSITEGESLELNFTLEEDLLGLTEIVVTADRSEMKRTESVTIVNTISPKLFSASQSLTLSEGLGFSPGLRIENNCQNCGFSQVRMNGMEGPYSQILINSRPIFSGLAGVYGLELIPANMVERVEVIRGGGSALYGSNAIAGTINILLKEPSTESFEAGINSGLTGFGTTGSAGIAADHSVNLNTSLVTGEGKTGISLYGFSRKREMFDANNDGFSEIAPMTNLTIGTRLHHRLGSRSKVDMDFFNIREERHGGNRQDYPLHERDIAESVKHDIKTGAIAFEKFFRDYDQLSVYASVQNLERDSYYGANRSVSDYGRSADLTYNTGIQYKAYLGRSSLIAGFEKTGGFLKDEKLGYPDYANAIIINDSIVSIPHTENITVSDQSSSVTGAFLQYDLKLDRIRLGLGGRFDHYAITDHARNNEARKGNVFSPRVSLMYEVFRFLQARLSYSQGFRAPQIFDEDLHIETSGARKVINTNDPALKQETSHSITASLDFSSLMGTVSTGFLVEGFYTRLENPFVNEIRLPDENGIVLYKRKNASEGAVVTGINMELKLRPLRNFSLLSGFTVQSSHYDKGQQFDRREFLRTPTNYGYLNLDWDFEKNTCFSATAGYTGKMLIPYFGPQADTDYGILRESEPFLDLGGKISYNIKVNGATLQLSAGIKNIFNSYQSDFDSGINRDPSYIYGPMAPRTLFFGIKIGNQL